MVVSTIHLLAEQATYVKTDAQEHKTYSCVRTPLAIKQFNMANIFFTLLFHVKL